MPIFKAFLANCFILGNETTIDSSGRTIPNKIQLELDGFNLEILQKPNIVFEQVDRFIGQFIPTTDIIFRDIIKQDIPRIENLLYDLCWILSFAGLSKVLYYGYEFPEGSGLTSRQSVIGVANFFRPTINIRKGSIVKSFISSVYPNYKKLKKKRKLNVIIDYLVQAEMPEQPTELKLLISFIILESLKDTYAKDKCIPYIKGFFRKQPKPSKGSDRYSFEELLNKMFQSVKMKRGLKRIIKLRNEIIHSGVSRLSHESKWKIYERAHELIREYLLKLFGYKGKYYSFKGRIVKVF